MKRLALLATATLLLSAAGPARAQEEPGAPPEEPVVVDTTPLHLSGPRFGVTVATGETARRLEEQLGARPVFTQFGWQYERQLFRLNTGLTGVTEWVPLIGGLEQGLFLPSLSFIVGLRTPGGAEFGLGPNISAAGAAYVAAVGVTHSYGGLNMPVNVSAALSGDGVRLSLLVGFTIARAE